MSDIKKKIDQKSLANTVITAQTQFAEIMNITKSWDNLNTGMSGMKDIVKAMKQQESLSAYTAGMDTVAKMLRSPNGFGSQIKAMGSFSEMLKNIHKQTYFSPAYLSATSDLANALKDVKNSLIPKGAFETLSSIALQQQKLFSSFENITQSFHSSNAFANLNSLRSALQGISGSVAGIYAKNKKWDLLKDFEKINEEVVAISDRVNEQEYASKEDIEDIKGFLTHIELKIDQKDKDALSILFKFMAVISLILALLAEARNWVAKPESATKEDIETLRRDLLNNADTKLSECKDYRIVLISCKVFLKPKRKSYVLSKLPINFQVLVLQERHKWLFISYTNPKDGMSETGWVIKKYLKRKR